MSFSWLRLLEKFFFLSVMVVYTRSKTTADLFWMYILWWDQQLVFNLAPCSNGYLATGCAEPLQNQRPPFGLHGFNAKFFLTTSMAPRNQTAASESLQVYRGNLQTSTWVRLPFLPLFYVSFTCNCSQERLFCNLSNVRYWQSLSWSAMVGEYPGLTWDAQGSLVSGHCSKCYSASCGVTGLNTNVLAKLTRKRKYGNICHQKILLPLSFLSVKQWLTESF